ncbi:hypothetical protein D1007_37036 [Hordeum vulgare]|nr:hypothetical protein D1007_37036 [Hordeum vulgare]
MQIIYIYSQREESADRASTCCIYVLATHVVVQMRGNWKPGADLLTLAREGKVAAKQEPARRWVDPADPWGQVGAGSADPNYGSRPTHTTHWPRFFGPGQ